MLANKVSIAASALVLPPNRVPKTSAWPRGVVDLRSDKEEPSTEPSWAPEPLRGGALVKGALGTQAIESRGQKTKEMEYSGDEASGKRSHISHEGVRDAKAGISAGA